MAGNLNSGRSYLIAAVRVFIYSNTYTKKGHFSGFPKLLKQFLSIHLSNHNAAQPSFHCDWLNVLKRWWFGKLENEVFDFSEDGKIIA